jgi:hypothetical protein
MKLTAYRADDDEPWRIERLREVAVRCPRKVIALHDHKGTLSVNWLTPPSIEELTEVIQAWSFHYEYCLEHYVIGFPLSAEVSGPCPFEVAA